MQNKKFALGPLGANAYVVTVGGESVVIDPGDVSEEFCAYLQRLPSIKYVLLTHRHCDHVSAAEYIRQTYGAKIAIHTEDAEAWNTPEGNLANRMHGMYTLKTVPPADIALQNGDALVFGNTKIEVLHTPGHSAGGVCFIIGDTIFTGDTLMQGAIGRFDFPTGDRAALFSSLRRLKQLPQNYRVCPGHGGDTTLYDEIGTNPYMLMLG